ncbi:MAG: HypC/HybG/HupF family hydrogenase formation chaperone [Eubacterium sp.]|nr:HypC/HybG/HupF family hydrogenase formation chaperone [Eubacterium sp.]MDE6155620.1 HypC/HybG/HupF family hydrogenase formation chaperone [Eubacterium sp.]MDE6469895.1 HypC/HybG/HupF family hydrogenase formation chaperone [Eubacterium sp.]MDE6766861.1 HypC/HybG/HupF family hydrogenase formation chaperone [Eubacterium sp.]
MCVAAPGKVVEINGDTAVIDYNGNKVNANKGIVDVKIGDWALVHAGLIIQILPEDEAQNMIDIFNELGELS